MVVGAGSSDDGGRMMVTNSVKLFLMAVSTHTHCRDFAFVIGI